MENDREKETGDEGQGQTRAGCVYPQPYRRYFLELIL